MTEHELVGHAENAIARILRDLERDTGSLIKAVTVDSVDMTNMGDNRRQLQMCVDIELVRLPGHDWACGA